jgi:hypothetical protein
VSVLVTVAFIVIVAMWAITIYSRLVRLRTLVTNAWKLLAVDQTKVAAQNVYNAHVDKYNTALEAFPAYLIAPLSGLSPARRFEPKSEIRDPKSEI